MPSGDNVTYGAVSIGTSAAVIRSGASQRDAVIVQNAHASNTLYLGDDSSVTTSNGLAVVAGDSVLVPTRGPIYGIASGASTDVRFFDVS